jgi:DNA adenine methylase
MSVPHPFPYQGSKRKIAQSILSYFPNRSVSLIEPFAGSAAVSIAAAFYDKAHNFIINDKNQAIIRLWESILNKPLEITAKYSQLWENQFGYEHEFYDHIRFEFNKNGQPDYFLFLLARCVKASVRYNNFGEFNQSPDNRRKGMAPETMKRNILAISAVFTQKNIKLYSKDYRDILNMATSDSIVYMDPPYQGVCNNRDSRYIQGVEFDDFMEALADLNLRSVPFILSYDGITGKKTYGRQLPDFLKLKQVFINAGPSTQSTLLGRNETTFESLYISPALMNQIEIIPRINVSQLELAFV